MPWSRGNATANQGLNIIPGVLSKFIGGTFKTSLGTVNNLILSPGWTKLYNANGVIKSPNPFPQVLILRDRFSPQNSARWSQPGYWDRVLQMHIQQPTKHVWKKFLWKKTFLWKKLTTLSWQILCIKNLS